MQFNAYIYIFHYFFFFLNRLILKYRVLLFKLEVEFHQTAIR